MPTFLQNLSYFFPSTFSVEIVRSRIIQNESLFKALSEFGYIIVYGLIYCLIGAICIKLSLNKAKRDGSLSHFLKNE